MKTLIIDSHESLIENLKSPSHDDALLIIEFNIIHNLGIPILKETLNHYKYPHKIVFNCGNSLSYCIFAIENHVPYILINCDDPILYEQISTLGLKYNSVIFPSKEKLFVYFQI